MIQLQKQPDRTTAQRAMTERPSTSSAKIAHIPESELSGFLHSRRESTLALLYYGNSFKPASPDPYPTVHLDLPQLYGPPVAEVWTSALPVRYHNEHQIHTAMNDHVLFGSVHLDESGAQGLAAATYDAYRRILHLIHELDYPHLNRIWNYFPGINCEHDSLERYQLFSIGRHQAFLECRMDFQQLLPAATTVGTESGLLHIHFLASRTKGQHVENPRQVSAYHYPRIYGPSSPSFARATIEDTGAGKRLFLAGTSSIVGHATRHGGDPSEQTRETLRNLAALVHHAGFDTTSPFSDLVARGDFKVYIRHPQHLDAIRQTLSELEQGARSVLFLRGDICRPALLLEIEGTLNT